MATSKKAAAKKAAAKKTASRTTGARVARGADEQAALMEQHTAPKRERVSRDPAISERTDDDVAQRQQVPAAALDRVWTESSKERWVSGPTQQQLLNEQLGVEGTSTPPLVPTTLPTGDELGEDNGVYEKDGREEEREET